MSKAEAAVSEISALAHVDWLSFTVAGAADQWVNMWESLHPLIGQPFLALTELKTGWNGYDHRVNIGHNGEFGLIAHGGASQRGSVHVALNAHACARIPDWAALVAWGKEHEARIARLDVAHDDLEGREVNLAKARQWLDEGGFNANGRPPSRKLVDDLGTGAGSTLYVGARKNGKLARLYEKGKQLGDPESPWFRVEVEWRGKDRVIPWDALLNCAELLTGAYPCLEYLTELQQKIQTCKVATKITYNRSAGSAMQAARR